MDINIGSLIRGKYRVDRVVGKGGMGVVVAATHLGLDQVVAIKFLLPDMLTQEVIVERFAREARAASKIQSDHVARVMDVDALEDGTPYMVMEYLAGHDLSFVRKKGKRLPVNVAVTYILEACEALMEAHRLGIIHRDLKPANLFVSLRADGKERVKVLDFGISKVGGPEGEASMTSTQAIVGSAEYMSPELMLSAREADARSDIWALGVTLYELLTARVPFRGESLTQVCAMVLQIQPDPPSMIRDEIAPGLDAVVMRCLEKDRTRRFQTVRELVDALQPFRSAIDAVPSLPAFGPPPTAATPAAPPASPSQPSLLNLQAPVGVSSSQPNLPAPLAVASSSEPNLSRPQSLPGVGVAPTTAPSYPINFAHPGALPPTATNPTGPFQAPAAAPFVPVASVFSPPERSTSSSGSGNRSQGGTQAIFATATATPRSGSSGLPLLLAGGAVAIGAIVTVLVLATHKPSAPAAEATAAVTEAPAPQTPRPTVTNTASVSPPRESAAVSTAPPADAATAAVSAHPSAKPTATSVVTPPPVVRPYQPHHTID